MLQFLPMGLVQDTGPGMPKEEGMEETMFGQRRGFYHTGRSKICQSGPCTEKTGYWKGIRPHLEVRVNSQRTQTGPPKEKEGQVKAGMTR